MKTTMRPKANKPIFLFFLLTFLLSATASLAARPDSFADLAEELSPIVVNISTTQTVKTPMMSQFPFGHKELPDMFRRFFNMPHHPQLRQRKQEVTSLGSGVIISSDGYIVTKNHVVEEAEKISVRFANHEEVEAKIIGRDPKTDLALIKIEIDHGLQYVEFGDSDSLRVGDWVIAIGNPFGLEQTVTAGIVSAKGRRIGGTAYENFIQTDASINPGNSGGPLFDLNGKMVGVNTAIFSRSGGNIGIGFAIPVNMAKNVVKQLKEDGKVTRGWLGVMIQQVDQALANEFKMERPEGALVGEVVADSPAGKAGIKSGDIIVEYGGRKITEMNMLPGLVAQTAVGEKVEVVLIRDGKRKEVQVEIVKLEEDELASAEDEAESRLGMTVQELTPELAGSLELGDAGGLIIAGVTPDSPAADAGLRRGDLILEINRQPVSDLSAYAEMLKSNEGKRILFLIKRNDHTRFVVVTAE